MNDLAHMAFDTPAEPTVTRSMTLYYRHRTNGVTVFRMEVSNRQRRIELNQVASISKRGEIVPHRRFIPTEAELAEMAEWYAVWTARSDAEELDETEHFMVQLNQFTDWLHRRAEDTEVDAHSDALLMALLDLRQVVVRRLSNMPGEGDDAGTDDATDDAPEA